MSGSSRRRFLHRCASLAAGGLLLPQLGALRYARAAGPPLPGYKALVCIYLAGGNDSFNLLVPRDGDLPGSRYAEYAAARGGVYSLANPLGLALAHDDLLDLGTPPGSGSAYGLHPNAGRYLSPVDVQFDQPGLEQLFANQKLAFVANVGPLLAPTTMADVRDGTPLPPQLFSHSDQEALWHFGQTADDARHGWGGRAFDALGLAPPSGLSPCISMAGAARLLVGEQVQAYQMSASIGVSLLAEYSGAYHFGNQRKVALLELLHATQPDRMTAEYARTMDRAMNVGASLDQLLDGAGGQVFTPYEFAGNQAPDPASGTYASAQLSLAGKTESNILLDQLRMVARMIRVSRSLPPGDGQTRQIYYVRLDGWDTHGDQMRRHPLLLARLSQALGWFSRAMDDLQVSNEVTAFTMSDFGRTLSSNGDGSDHAWGGVQIVTGGAVAGGRIEGHYPELGLNRDDDAGRNWSFDRGQYIPSTSVDQMMASLARWWGVEDGALDAVFPNLSRFGPPLSLFT